MATNGLDFVQAVPHVASLIYRSYQLWQEVQGVPKEVKSLLEHLKALEPIFREIEGHILHRDNVSPGVVSSLELSRQARSSLEAMICDLETQLHHKMPLKRKLAAVKVLVKKPVLDRLEQSLSRSLELLKLALSTYQMGLMMRFNPESIVQMAMANLCVQGQEARPTLQSRLQLQAPSSISTRSQSSQRQPIAHLTDGLSLRGAVRSFERQADGRTHAKREATFKYGLLTFAYQVATGAWKAQIQLPSWLSQRVYEIMSAPAIAGWTYGYRVYNTIPPNAEIIQRIMEEDIPGMLELFRTGEASLFDQTAQGDSLLHIAMGWQKWELCRLLLKMGLESQMRVIGRLGSATAFSPLFWLTYYEAPFNGRKLQHPHMATLLVYLTPDVGDIPVEAQFYYDLLAPERRQSLHLLDVFRHYILPDFFARPLRERLEAIRFAALTQFKPEAVEQLLPRDGPDGMKLMISHSIRERISLVHSVAVLLGRAVSQNTYMKPERRDKCVDWEANWRSIIITRVLALAALEELSSVELVIPALISVARGWRGTPLTSVIGQALSSSSSIGVVNPLKRLWRLILQRSLQKWLEFLLEAGFDLVAYGKQELSILHDPDPQNDLKGAFDVDSARLPQDFVFDSQYLLRKLIDPQKFIGRDSPFHYYSLPFRIIDLKIGPQPSDWEILWAPEYEYWANEFWSWAGSEESSVEGVHGASPAMPGAWVDGDA